MSKPAAKRASAASATSAPAPAPAAPVDLSTADKRRKLGPSLVSPTASDVEAEAKEAELLPKTDLPTRSQLRECRVAVIRLARAFAAHPVLDDIFVTHVFRGIDDAWCDPDFGHPAPVRVGDWVFGEEVDEEVMADEE